MSAQRAAAEAAGADRARIKIRAELNANHFAFLNNLQDTIACMGELQRNEYQYRGLSSVGKLGLNGDRLKMHLLRQRNLEWLKNEIEIFKAIIGLIFIKMGNSPDKENQVKDATRIIVSLCDATLDLINKNYEEVNIRSSGFAVINTAYLNLLFHSSQAKYVEFCTCVASVMTEFYAAHESLEGAEWVQARTEWVQARTEASTAASFPLRSAEAHAYVAKWAQWLGSNPIFNRPDLAVRKDWDDKWGKKLIEGPVNTKELHKDLLHLGGRGGALRIDTIVQCLVAERADFYEQSVQANKYTYAAADPRSRGAHGTPARPVLMVLLPAPRENRRKTLGEILMEQPSYHFFEPEDVRKKLSEILEILKGVQ